MEFVTEFDHIYGDTLFDAFDVDTFYEEIQRSPEYKAEHSRLIPRKKGLIKLEPGNTIIINGAIIKLAVSAHYKPWQNYLSQ